jgi:hypothetical protein
MHNFFSKFKLKNKYIIIISKIKQFKTHNFLKGIQAVRIEFFVYIKSCHYSMNCLILEIIIMYLFFNLNLEKKLCINFGENYYALFLNYLI